MACGNDKPKGMALVSALIWITSAVFFPFVVALLPFHWLACRLWAERCPECASKWRTELVGEWDGEMWSCHACGHYWEVK